MSDLAKVDMFNLLGYAGSYDELDAHLVASGLTTKSKERICATKREIVAAALSERFLRVCRRGDCQARARLLAHGRAVVPATSSGTCQVCGGSAAAGSLAEMERACTAAGWRRLCVVGGSPKSRLEIRETIRPPLEVRLVDGTASRTGPEARDDIQWADHVVLWGGTELDHKVSNLYGRAAKTSTLVKRSVQELWAHIASAAIRAAAGPGVKRGTA